jgi:uncharacterized protein YjlB
MTGPETYSFESDVGLPKQQLPALVYRDVEACHAPIDCKELFARNGWLGAWVNGIHPFHRLHSTAHEVLGIVDGSGSIVLGGPDGHRVEVAAGDALVLPAGIVHSNGGAVADFVVVGAYPGGMSWDLRLPEHAEHDEVLANIESVPFPDADPVHGPDGPLIRIWRRGSDATS